MQDLDKYFTHWIIAIDCPLIFLTTAGTMRCNNLSSRTFWQVLTPKNFYLQFYICSGIINSFNLFNFCYALY